MKFDAALAPMHLADVPSVAQAADGAFSVIRSSTPVIWPVVTRIGIEPITY